MHLSNFDFFDFGGQNFCRGGGDGWIFEKCVLSPPEPKITELGAFEQLWFFRFWGSNFLQGWGSWVIFRKMRSGPSGAENHGIRCFWATLIFSIFEVKKIFWNGVYDFGSVLCCRLGRNVYFRANWPSSIILIILHIFVSKMMSWECLYIAHRKVGERSKFDLHLVPTPLGSIKCLKKGIKGNLLFNNFLLN